MTKLTHDTDNCVENQGLRPELIDSTDLFLSDKFAYANQCNNRPEYSKIIDLDNWRNPKIDHYQVDIIRKPSYRVNSARRFDSPDKVNTWEQLAPTEPAKRSEFIIEPEFVLNPPPTNTELYGCITNYIEGVDGDYHFHKAVVCGKEYCKYCGMDYSLIHNRRIMRAKPKIMQMQKWSYLVITFPKPVQKLAKEKGKEFLQDFRNYMRRSIKAGLTYRLEVRNNDGTLKRVIRTRYLNNARGMIRWHWTGDDHQNWHPHLNILLEHGHLPLNKLIDLRAKVKIWMMKYFELSECQEPVINYAYTPDKGKALHWMRYILRATGKFTRDRELKRIIKGFTNTTYFGKFDKVEPTDQAEQVAAGVNPITGNKIKWHSIIKPYEFNVLYKKFARPINWDAEPEAQNLGFFITDINLLIPWGVQLDLKI